VPWNNNNAENAVKQFAYYREVVTGMMTEGGLGDYLVLLSLCQTCRYRGISFLRFLMSGERSVDAFQRRGRARRRLPAIQVYPRGFVPPHFASRDRARARRERPAAGEAVQESP
jgi:hypothetical protein